MKIEIIDNKILSEIHVDEELWREFHKKLYRNYLSEIKRASSKNELSALFFRLDVKVGRGLVYRWLALRGFMKAELRKKLTAYKIDSRAIDAIFSECEKLGYLDDEREGMLFIERHKRKGWGPNKIAQKLVVKAPELKEMVRSAISDKHQEEEIQKWIKKKTRSADLNDIKVKGRIYRFLIGKGFDDRLIRSHLFVD